MRDSSSLSQRDDAAARVFSRGRDGGNRGQRVRICRLRADARNVVSADGGVQDQSGGAGGGRDLDCAGAGGAVRKNAEDLRSGCFCCERRQRDTLRNHAINDHGDAGSLRYGGEILMLAAEAVSQLSAKFKRAGRMPALQGKRLTSYSGAWDSSASRARQLRPTLRKPS